MILNYIVSFQYPAQTSSNQIQISLKSSTEQLLELPAVMKCFLIASPAL